MFGNAQMIKFRGRKSNPNYIKKKVSFFYAVFGVSLVISIFLFLYMIGCIAYPNHPILLNKEFTVLSILIQAVLFLISISCYIYVDKLKLIFKVNLYKIPKEGKTRISKKRSYRIHLKKRLKLFMFFEIFFVLFFVVSLIITRLFGSSFGNQLFEGGNSFFKAEFIFLIYTVVGLIAMAVNLMHVNYLIQLSAKVFRKKPKSEKVVFQHYDFD